MLCPRKSRENDCHPASDLHHANLASKSSQGRFVTQTISAVAFREPEKQSMSPGTVNHLSAIPWAVKDTAATPPAAAVTTAILAILRLPMLADLTPI